MIDRKLRNDAALNPPAGANRLSPHRHCGCASRLGLVLEAPGTGEPGTEQVLDESRIRRELPVTSVTTGPRT